MRFRPSLYDHIVRSSTISLSSHYIEVIITIVRKKAFVNQNKVFNPIFIGEVLSQPVQVAPKKGKAAAAPAPQTPEKKQKRKKQADAPKKPMSAFFCFQMARRAGLKEEAPELNHKDIIKVSMSKESW